MPEFYAYDELDTEEGFIAVVRRLPKPVPPELLPVYRRLRAFGLRRGWHWPYRNYVPSDRRATPGAPGIGYVAPLAPLAAPAPIAPELTEQPESDAARLNWDQRSTGHLLFVGKWEYCQGDTNDVYRAWRGYPVKDEYRVPAEWLGHWDQCLDQLVALGYTPR